MNFSFLHLQLFALEGTLNFLKHVVYNYVTVRLHMLFPPPSLPMANHPLASSECFS